MNAALRPVLGCCLALLCGACATTPMRHGKGGLDTLAPGADKAARVAKYRELEISHAEGAESFEGYGLSWQMEELPEYIYGAGYARPEGFGHDRSRIRNAWLLMPLTLAAGYGLYARSAKEEAGTMAAFAFGGSLLALDLTFLYQSRAFKPEKVAPFFNRRLMQDLELKPEDLNQP